MAAIMTGTEALEIVSSSINDTSCRNVRANRRIFAYIDALNGDVETIATATLNGTTAWQLAPERAKNIQWMEIRTTGDPRRTTRERSRYARPGAGMTGTNPRAATAPR